MNVLPVGVSVPLNFLIELNGQGLNFQTPGVILRRQNDGAYWTGTGFSNTLVILPLAPVDPINEPGLYSTEFNQAVDNEPNFYTAFFVNTGTYAGNGIDEYYFSFIDSDCNPYEIAKVVQATIFTDPNGQINPDDVASQTTLINVENTIDNVSNQMALQSTLVSTTTTIINDLNTIIGVLTPITGPNQVQFTILDSSNNPIPSVQVVIKNTTSQVTISFGVASINGQIVFGLPTGTFNALFYLPFYTFGIQPYQFTITTNQTFTITGTSFIPTPPATNQCSLFAYILDGTGLPVSQACVRVKYITNSPFVSSGSVLIKSGWNEVFTNGAGFFSINVLIGATIEISIPCLGYSISDFLVPNQPSLDLSTLVGYIN